MLSRASRAARALSAAWNTFVHIIRKSNAVPLNVMTEVCRAHASSACSTKNCPFVLSVKDTPVPALGSCMDTTCTVSLSPKPDVSQSIDTAILLVMWGVCRCNKLVIVCNAGGAVVMSNTQWAEFRRRTPAATMSEAGSGLGTTHVFGNQMICGDAVAQWSWRHRGTGVCSFTERALVLSMILNTVKQSRDAV